MILEMGFRIPSEIVYLLKTENKIICKFFFSFYRKTFYSESTIVLYDPVSMQFLFLFGFLSFIN